MSVLYVVIYLFHPTFKLPFVRHPSSGDFEWDPEAPVLSQEWQGYDDDWSGYWPSPLNAVYCI